MSEALQATTGELFKTTAPGTLLLAKDANGKWSGPVYEEIKAQILSEITAPTEHN